MTNQPSIPHPEDAERRAAITREIQATTGLDGGRIGALGSELLCDGAPG